VNLKLDFIHQRDLRANARHWKIVDEMLANITHATLNPDSAGFVLGLKIRN